MKKRKNSKKAYKEWIAQLPLNAKESVGFCEQTARWIFSDAFILGQNYKPEKKSLKKLCKKHGFKEDYEYYNYIADFAFYGHEKTVKNLFKSLRIKDAIGFLRYIKEFRSNNTDAILKIIHP